MSTQSLLPERSRTLPLSARELAPAMTLSERAVLASRRRYSSGLSTGAESRFHFWQRTIGLLPSTIEDAWCHEFAVTRDQLSALLSIDPDHYEADVEAMPWFQAICSVLSLYVTSRYDGVVHSYKNAYRLASAAWPWLSWARTQAEQSVRQQYKQYPTKSAEYNEIVSLFVLSLISRLYNIAERTLILAFNIAKEQGVLSGIPVDQQYDSFCERIQRQEHAMVVWREYPVLCRLLTEASMQWVSTVVEFIARYDEDRSRICDELNVGKDAGRIVSVNVAGDRHDAGRAVTVIQFENGAKVVYKPRQVTTELLFGRICKWVGGGGAKYELKTPVVIDKGAYGWCEFIKASTASSEDEVRRFYYRAGVLAGLGYFLGVSDLISENIVASGEYPVPIDVECCLSGMDEDAFGVAGIARNNSLLFTGVLPCELLGDGLDISALGGLGRRDKTPYRIPIAIGHGTPDLRIQSKFIPMPVSHNIPVDCGERMDLSKYQTCVEEGFTDISLFLRNNKIRLGLSKPLLQLSEINKARYLVRGTAAYGKLLQAMTHPLFLTEAVNVDAVLTKLWQGDVWRSNLISAERRQLWRLDIPCFYSSPSGSDLESACGARFSQCFYRTGIQKMNDHLAEDPDHDHWRHKWTIRTCLSVKKRCEPGTALDERLLDKLSSVPKPASPVAIAVAIAEHIAALAFSEGDLLSWIDVRSHGRESFQNRPSQQYEVGPIDAFLYRGLSGLMVMFRLVHLVSRAPLLSRTAGRAAKTLFGDHPAGRLSTRSGSIGAFTGPAGVLYALLQSRMWLRPEQVGKKSNELLDFLETNIPLDTELDFVRGAAGTLCVLLQAAAALDSDRALGLALRCGEFILQRAEPAGPGIGWNVGNSRYLAGFGHGNAGFAYALLRLWHATSNERFLEAALRATEYEDSLFDTATGCWPDLRDWRTHDSGSKGAGTDIAWCSGAPGIGLARLELYRATQARRAKAMLEAALEQTTTGALAGASDTLCHGTLGSLELLLQACDIYPSLTSTIDAMRTNLVGRIGECHIGLDYGQESLGLMGGLAGCAYGLARASRPALIPSVLTLDITSVESIKERERETHGTWHS